MNIYTVAFFGHRKIDNINNIEKALESVLYELITQKEYVEFLIGRDGDFDLFAASVIRRCVKKYACGNTNFTLVLPYMKAEYRDNKEYYLNYYDEVEICEASANAHYKAAISLRNKYLADCADLIVCFIQNNSGGAYKAVQYGKNIGKKVINIADNIIGA